MDELDDDSAFDLAWMPIPFIPEPVIHAATPRLLRALRPGGWVVFNLADIAEQDPATASLWRLRVTSWGGPLWTPEQIVQLLVEHGFMDVRRLPMPPRSVAALVAARRHEIGRP